jgi:hypothetical protein
MPEISILRTEIDELNESVANWLGEIDLLTQQIEDAREEISTKTAEIERLEAEAARGDLITQLTEALAGMSTEQLAGLVSSLQSGETPTIQPAPVVEEHPTVTVNTVTDTLQEIESADVTFDMLTDAMHNAAITLVGIKYQDLWRMHHQVPAIGDRITLAKRDGSASQNTVGYTTDGISVGILPASDDKFAQLERIGANSINNRTVGLDHSIFDTEYEVVGVICGAFIFLNPVTADETVEVAEEQPSNNINMMNLDVMGVRASDEQHARRLFNERMPDHCTLTRIESVGNNFVAHYNNHRANTMEGMTQAIIIPKAE